MSDSWTVLCCAVRHSNWMWRNFRLFKYLNERNVRTEPERPLISIIPWYNTRTHTHTRARVSQTLTLHNSHSLIKYQMSDRLKWFSPHFCFPLTKHQSVTSIWALDHVRVSTLLWRNRHNDNSSYTQNNEWCTFSAFDRHVVWMRVKFQTKNAIECWHCVRTCDDTCSPNDDDHRW